MAKDFFEIMFGTKEEREKLVEKEKNPIWKEKYFDLIDEIKNNDFIIRGYSTSGQNVVWGTAQEVFIQDKYTKEYKNVYESSFHEIYPKKGEDNNIYRKSYETVNNAYKELLEYRNTQKAEELKFDKLIFNIQQRKKKFDRTEDDRRHDRMSEIQRIRSKFASPFDFCYNGKFEKQVLSQRVKLSLTQLHSFLNDYNLYSNEILTEFELYPEKLFIEDEDFSKDNEIYSPKKFEYIFERENDKTLKITFCHYEDYEIKTKDSYLKTDIERGYQPQLNYNITIYFNIYNWKPKFKINFPNSDKDDDGEDDMSWVEPGKIIYILGQSLSLITEERFYNDINKLLTVDNICFE